MGRKCSLDFCGVGFDLPQLLGRRLYPFADSMCLFLNSFKELLYFVNIILV
jgi:hypothetical protein